MIVSKVVGSEILAAVKNKLFRDEAWFLQNASIRYETNEHQDVLQGYFTQLPRIEGTFSVPKSLVFKINTGHLNFTETPACINNLAYTMFFQMSVDGHIPCMPQRTIPELLTYNGKNGAFVSHVEDIRYRGTIDQKKPFPGYIEATHVRAAEGDEVVFQAKAAFGINREHLVEGITFGIRL